MFFTSALKVDHRSQTNQCKAEVKLFCTSLKMGMLLKGCAIKNINKVLS